MASPAPHPLTIPDFRAYFIARFATMLAGTALILVIGWQVYGIARESLSIRESAFLLGLIGLVQFLPLFFLTPFVGWAADRFDRRVIARATLGLQIVCAAVLGTLTFLDRQSLVALFSVAALLGVARAFAGPALSALAPNLVPRAVLPTAIAVSSIAWQVGSVIGPSLGGVLFAIDPDLAYAACFILYSLALVALFAIGPVPQPAMERGRRPLAQMVDGIAYVRQNRLVMAAITLDLFAVLLAGATALLPVYARDILKVGADGLGLLAAAPAIGAALMAFVFSFRPIRTNVGIKMLAAVIVFGIATIVFGLSTWFPLSVAALAVAGGADMFSVYVRQSLIQLHTPDEMRGRVSSVSLLTISASNELGEAESGFLAALIGPVAAVVVGGAGAIIVTLVWSRLYPELRLAKSFDPPDSRPTPG